MNLLKSERGHARSGIAYNVFTHFVLFLFSWEETCEARHCWSVQVMKKGVCVCEVFWVHESSLLVRALTSRPHLPRSCCWWRPRRLWEKREARFSAWPSGTEETESGMERNPWEDCCWENREERTPGSYGHCGPETSASERDRQGWFLNRVEQSCNNIL